MSEMRELGATLFSFIALAVVTLDYTRLHVTNTTIVALTLLCIAPLAAVTAQLWWRRLREPSDVDQWTRGNASSLRR